MAEITVTSKNFSNEVEKSQLPVIADFWASWCGPCRMLSPILEQAAKELEGKAVVAKINVDDEPELANKFSISSIPTIMVFKNGKVVKKSIGVISKEQIIGLLD
jgi:thioredoxin